MIEDEFVLTYVSAEWVDLETGGRIIKAIGDDGKEYWVPEIHCDVPPWPRFLESEAGKTFLEASQAG